jgi:hypothetical protein
MLSGFDHSSSNAVGYLRIWLGLEFLYTHPPGPPRRRKWAVRGRSAIEVVATLLSSSGPSETHQAL